MTSVDTGEWLEALAGNSSRVRLNARSAAALATSIRCNARRALDVAGIDKAALAVELGYKSTRGQSPFALGRGNQFERRVKRDVYLEMLELLKPYGLDTQTVDVLDLRDEVPFEPGRADEVLAERAVLTRTAILEIADGTAPPGRLLDGGALEWSIGGQSVRLEADAIAWWVGGKLRIVEVKSFPVEWGLIPKEKVTAAAWQTAVYVAALQDLLAAKGHDPGIVSTVIFLICPKNTGLKPVIVEHDVAPQLRLLRRHERTEIPLVEIARRAGDVTVDVSNVPAPARSAALANALDRLGPAYQPNCLSTCELAEHCRSCAQKVGDPAVMGGAVLQVSVGISDLHRAAALLKGARPKSGAEKDFAELAAATRRVEQVVLG